MLSRPARQIVESIHSSPFLAHSAVTTVTVHRSPMQPCNAADSIEECEVESFVHCRRDPAIPLVFTPSIQEDCSVHMPKKQSRDHTWFHVELKEGTSPESGSSVRLASIVRSAKAFARRVLFPADSTNAEQLLSRQTVAIIGLANKDAWFARHLPKPVRCVASSSGWQKRASRSCPPWLRQ